MNREDDEVEFVSNVDGYDEENVNAHRLSLFKYIDKPVVRKERKTPSRQTKRLTHKHIIDITKETRRTAERKSLRKGVKRQKKPPRIKTLTGLAVAPFLGPSCTPSSLAENYRTLKLQTPVLSPQSANVRIGRQRLNFVSQDTPSMTCESIARPESKFSRGKSLWRAATTGCFIDLDKIYSDESVTVIEDSPVASVYPNAPIIQSDEESAGAPSKIVYDSEDSDVPISQRLKDFAVTPGLSISESLMTWTNAELAMQISAFGLKAVKSRAMMISSLSRCYLSTSKPPNLPLTQSNLQTSRGLHNLLFLRVTGLLQMSQSEWYERVLSYQPIVVEHLAEWLCTQDCLIDAKELKAWCEAYSVCCVYEESLAVNRKKRKNKNSQPEAAEI